MRRAVFAAALAVVPSLSTVSSVAHADPIVQDNQLVFGLSGMYVPAQNNLVGTDVLGIGHYVQYSHAIDCFHVGFRLALSITTGPQYVINPDVLLGVHVHTGRLAVRFDVGSGPLVNGGDGFATAVIDHTYLRATAQVRVVKSVIVEAFGGPGFIIGPVVAGVMAEWGVGVGWNF